MPHDDEREHTDDELCTIGLEIQLYLAGRYNLDAVDSATVFTMALGETLAYGLKPSSTVESVVQGVVPLLTRFAEHRRDHPPAMGLRDLVAQFRQRGGKALVN